MSNIKDIKNKLKYNNNINVNNNVNDNNSIIFNYQLNDLELSKDDIEFLLSNIINSKIDGNKLHSVFNLTLKLQYKLKLLEDKK